MESHTLIYLSILGNFDKKIKVFGDKKTGTLSIDGRVPEEATALSR